MKIKEQVYKIIEDKYKNWFKEKKKDSANNNCEFNKQFEEIKSSIYLHIIENEDYLQNP